MDGYIGEIRMTAYPWAQQDWHLCDGTSVTLMQYGALYSLIGFYFGGSGSNFLLPDLRGRVPRGAGTRPGNLSLVQLGHPLGAETYALQTADLAVHNHPATMSGTLSASGPASLPFSVAASLPFSVTPSLTVTGTGVLNAVNTNPAAVVTNTATAGCVLGSSGGTTKVYAAAGSGNAQFGPSATVSGTATGTVSGNATGTVSGNAASVGNLTLPVSGAGVTVGKNGSGLPFSLMNPTLGVAFVICVNGLYPMRP